MTDVWEEDGGSTQDHDWHVAREEELYHNSARELAEMVTDLQSRVEGLGQQNTELEKSLAKATETVDQLGVTIGQHEIRYANAIRMIQRRQESLAIERNRFKQLANRYVELSNAITDIDKSVRALKDVPVSELDNAIQWVSNAIDSAILG